MLITQDDICEIDRIEDFFSDLAYVSGIMPINIDPPRTRVRINDTNEPECGKYIVVVSSRQNECINQQQSLAL